MIKVKVIEALSIKIIIFIFNLTLFILTFLILNFLSVKIHLRVHLTFRVFLPKFMAIGLFSEVYPDLS